MRWKEKPSLKKQNAVPLRISQVVVSRVTFSAIKMPAIKASESHSKIRSEFVQ
jgi:hypothetical protein